MSKELIVINNTDLIKQSLECAATSLQSIINEEVKLGKLIQSEHSTALVSKDNIGSYNLSTELKGDIGGMSYLLLSATDIEKLFQKCLPSEVNTKDNAKNRKLKGEFLLELDNILVASAVTQLADSSGLFIYGDVPNLCLIRKEDQFVDDLDKAIETYNSPHCFKCMLNIPSLEMELEMVWVIDQGE